MANTSSGKGKVYLVGAGPGDPELITVRGLRLLQAAQVVVYDRLVSPALLTEAARTAEMIDVGKKGSCYHVAQERIHELLADRAERGLEVVRLKGGDPFLFGRGGEEALYLAQRQVPFEIVSGVTSALAAPAAAGIPVTFRGVASSVAFVTGHQAQESTGEINWSRLAESVDTMVVMMPLFNLRTIASRLVLAGKSLSTPAAVISGATWPQQRVVRGSLGTIARETERAAIESPALLVIGEVTRLADMLGVLTHSRPEEASHGVRRFDGVGDHETVVQAYRAPHANELA